MAMVLNAYSQSYGKYSSDDVNEFRTSSWLDLLFPAIFLLFILYVVYINKRKGGEVRKCEKNEINVGIESIEHQTETQRYTADQLDKNTFTKSDSQIFSSNARWERARSKEDILQLKPIVPKKTELVTIKMWLIILYVLLWVLIIYIIYRREYS